MTPTTLVGSSKGIRGFFSHSQLSASKFGFHHHGEGEVGVRDPIPFFKSSPTKGRIELQIEISRGQFQFQGVGMALVPFGFTRNSGQFSSPRKQITGGAPDGWFAPFLFLRQGALLTMEVDWRSFQEVDRPTPYLNPPIVSSHDCWEKGICERTQLHV